MNIKDLTRLHTELNPKLWYDNNLRREVELHLLQIAMAFVEFINIPNLQLSDITISGSNAGFNYNAKSDIDLHLVVDEASECYDVLKELFMAKKSLFNDQHDISIRGINVEVYVQEKNQTHISNGLYSILKDEWINQPKKMIADVDKTNVMHKFQFMKHEVEQAIASKDETKINHVKKRIKDMRSAGLALNGELGAENLAFKLLRNTGLMDELYDTATQAQDEKLSI